MDNATPNLSPTFLEMSARMRSKARNYRYKAALSGHDTPKGREYLESAESFDRIAAGLKESAVEQLYARDGQLDEYRKIAANRGVANV